MSEPTRETEPALAAAPPVAAPPQVRATSAADIKLDGVIAVVHRYGPAVTVLVLMLVVAWAYSHVFAGEPNGDDNTFHLGETRRIADCLMQGDYDFWNWSANAGYASGYYYQLLPLFTPAALTAASGGHLLFCLLNRVRAEVKHARREDGIGMAHQHCVGQVVGGSGAAAGDYRDRHRIGHRAGDL